MTRAERHVSDAFWSQVTDFGPYGYVYDSIEEMVADSHLVVRGTLRGTRDGIRFPYGSDFGASVGPWSETFAIVQILEVVKGNPIMREAGKIEVVGLGWPGIADSELPPGEVLLFLKNDTQWRAEQGVDESPNADTPFHYVRPNPYQTALQNIDGAVDLVDAPPGWRELGEFPVQLDGQPYDEAVQEARNSASRSQPAGAP